MVFVAALDPACISVCHEGGAFGEDHIIGVFTALLQNCLIAETEGSWRISQELRDCVESLPDGGIRKTASTFVETMLSPAGCRFVDVVPDDDPSVALGNLLCSQTENNELDVIISTTSRSDTTVELSAITAFNASNFARERSRRAAGLVYAPGAKSAAEVLEEAFRRVVGHCDRVEIYDRQMGKDFGANYFEAIEHWCRFFRSFDTVFELHIHTTASQASAVKAKFTEELEDSPIQLKVFGHEESQQPHDRFLRVRGFTFDIGRGVDLFDRSGNCRDVKIGLSDHGAFTKQWRSLSSAQTV